MGSQLCPDEPSRKNVGGPGRLETAEMVDAIVIRRDLTQLLLTHGPHNKAVPRLEELSDTLGGRPCLAWLCSPPHYAAR